MTFKVFDLETTSLYAYAGAKIFAYCIGDWDGKVIVRRTDSKGTSPKRARSRLQDFFNDTSIAKIAHNYKFELGMLKANGYHVPDDTVWHDTMIMSQMLQNLNPQHSLDYLAWQLCGWTRELDIKSRQLGKEYGGYQNIPVNHMFKYQIADGQRPMLLFRTWYPELKRNKSLYKDYLNEIELIKTTEQMECRGMMLDRTGTGKLLDWLEDEIINAQKQLYKRTGEHINMGSPLQVSKLLFKTLKLPPIKFNEKTGSLKTDKDVIMELREKHPHPILDILVKYRSYTKGRGLIEGYLEAANKQDIIHPAILTNRARTGREASGMQTVSKEKKGQEKTYPVPARRCFRARPNHFLLFVDYRSIELRLIVNAANQMEFIDLINKNGDPHAVAAEVFYEKKYIYEKDTKIKSSLRDRAKNAHFAIAYGAGPGKLASVLNLPIEKTIKVYDRYAERFPEVAFFTKNISSQVTERGYVKTPFGRKLFVNQDKPYIGANYLIQGTAAGILKRGQNKANEYFNTKHPPGKASIIIPIHDEIVIECHDALSINLKPFTEHVRRCMITMPEIKVKLDVDWKISHTTWDKAESLKFNIARIPRYAHAG